jgi:PAS domain S-box-containing protein
MSNETVPESFLVHSGTEIVHADHVFCTLVGAESREQLVGMSLTDLVVPDYHAVLGEQVARVENEDAPALGVAVELETFTGQSQSVIAVSSLIEWDGTQRVQTSMFPVAGADSPDGRLLRDRAMDEAPLGITISDPSHPDNPLIYVNDRFCELTGYDRDEILGQNCRFLQGDATREEPVARMRAAVDAGEPVTVELRNYRNNGSMFWNRVTITPIRSDSGAVTHYLGYQQDITPEKRYEQDLTLFEQQAEGSDKAIIITDSNGTIEYVNPAFERLSGYTASEATGLNPRILKSGQQDEAFYAELWEQITAGEVWEAELTNETKHGELFEVKQKIIPVTNERGDITNFVGIEQDITEERLTTQTLEVVNRILRHNLRNSLNVIDGHAELLESDEMDPDARAASIAKIRKEATSMREIAEKTARINEIRDPIENDHQWGQLDIESLVESHRSQYPDAELALAVEGDGLIRVRSPDLLAMAIDEAIENAIKHADHSPPGVEITVQRVSDPDTVRVAVADDGPGIPDIERQVIESGTETPLNHSLGVGLWVMEWAATTLGGELTISDAEPRGSVVTFHLPAAGTDGRED